MDTIKQNHFYKWWLANLALQWFTLGLCIKGQTVKAGVSPYANVAFEALSCLAGITVGLLFRHWGCRPLLTFGHALSAFMLLVQSLGLSLINAHVTLLGHFTANISLHSGLVVLQLLTPWMAPRGTTSRASLFGLCLAFFHIGHLVSHPLNSLVTLWIPTAVFAFFPAFAALAAFFLPDKGHGPLPEKFDDVIVLSKAKKQSYFEGFQVFPFWAKMKATLGFN